MIASPSAHLAGTVRAPTHARPSPDNPDGLRPCGRRAAVAENGTFRARWKADRPGPARVRARVEGTTATAASKPPEVAITLYRAHQATWYGPGFYGNQTACGQKMTRTLVGVAHKTLRCGTRIEFLHRGRTLVAPVVDRGPYVDGITWDLTAAAAQQLGFSGSGTIGALRLSEARR
jgi:rare lipoprotein A